MTDPSPTGSPSDRSSTVPPAGIPVDAYPIGVAPLAASTEVRAPRQRLRSTPRIVTAAAVTGAMALMPLAGPVALARERDRQEMRVASAELLLRQRAADRDAASAGATPGGDTGQAGARTASAAPAAAETPGPRSPTPIVAVSGIRLLVPSMETAVVGFHEAAMPGALEMASVAPLAANHNPRPMPTIEETQAEQVAPVMVLPTRARGQPPSTAVDIAVPAGEEILAPLGGTVTAVLPYELYGSHPDVRIEIQPTGRPDLRVILIHVDDVSVEVGDELRAGETRVAGTALHLPFESQIDRFAEEEVGRALPHVHIEVRPAA